jgi:hypothetical protein
MNGQSIRVAKDALTIFLQSLPENSKFNIVSFGDHYDSMFEESQSYSDEILETTIAAVSTFDADMGCTEILEPLKFIYK